MAITAPVFVSHCGGEHCVPKGDGPTLDSAFGNGVCDIGRVKMAPRLHCM